MKKSAFTLIELLVVISIIAILASIAVPVFSKAMETARATSDKSNLKQLGIGIVAYLNDNEDQMFPAADTGSGTFVPWPITLHNKYVTNWKVFRSPFDKRNDSETPPGVPVSYGINDNLFVQAGGVFNGNASKYAFPSQLILIAPVLTQDPSLTFPGVSETPGKLITPTAGGKYGTHVNRSQINACYADAHVASINYTTDFSVSTGDAGMRRWLPTGTVVTPTP